MNYPRADQSLRYLHGLRSQKLLPSGWNVLSETARGHSEVLAPLQTPLTCQQALASSCGQQLPRSAAGSTDHTGTQPSTPPLLNGSALSLGVLSLTVCKAQVPSALHQAEESTPTRFLLAWPSCPPDTASRGPGCATCPVQCHLLAVDRRAKEAHVSLFLSAVPLPA